MEQPLRTRLPRLLILLLGCLLLLNLLQAHFTDLLYDEAYYWYYAQTPAWGYFDHPPMVAWMIALGGLFGQGELGVRLLSCLMGTGTIALLWMLIDHPGRKEFLPQLLVWLFSIALIHAYGFLSLPDTPLLFFTALFLLVYRKFLNNPGLLTALALGGVMAALMYSKYHAALVILAVLASNPALLRNRYAWMALGVSLLAYAPHLHWLYQQDFVSVRYHLFERPNQMYRFDGFTLGFFLNLVALFGFTFPWAYYGLFTFRAGNRFERALVFVAVGIILFFFLSSFQRRVQTQWLIAVCIPMAVIVGRQLLDRPDLRRWIYRAGWANLAVMAVLRVGLVYRPFFPIRFETHGNKQWVEKLEAVAGDATVVFENSYRRASMFSFYSGRPSFTLNNAYYRKNQYSIDNSEDRVQGKKVFYLPVVNRETPYAYPDQDGEPRYGYFIESFKSFRKLQAGIRPDPPLAADRTGQFWVHNPYQRSISPDSLRFGIAYLDAFKKVMQIEEVSPESKVGWPQQIQPGDSLSFRFAFPPMPDGPPKFMRAVVTRQGLLWGLNGDSQKIVP